LKNVSSPGKKFSETFYDLLAKERYNLVYKSSTGESNGPNGMWKKLLYLVCFVSKKDLEEEERHRTSSKAKREHDVQEAVEFFKETPVWRRYFK